MLSREQRIRKEAQLQSLYTLLANYRKQETTYIENVATIPLVLINQINEARRDIIQIEGELFSLSSQPSKFRARDYYRQAVEAELAGDLNAALKLYRSAGRYGHADAHAAMRSIRYRQKQAKSKAVDSRMPLPARQSKNRLLVGLAGLAIILLIIATIALGGRSPAGSPNAAAIAPTTTPTFSPTPELIIPATATPLPVETPTSTPLPTNTPQPIPTEVISTTTPTPSPVPTLRAAPRIIDPKDGMVWGDGAVVFEFVKMDLADNELYCLGAMRGYDITNTENWSHPPRGNKQPYIAVEANVFRVARSQGMRCVVWSAYIGRDTCDSVVSEITSERVIGLPRPCDFGNR
jgi:hypothetical protein